MTTFHGRAGQILQGANVIAEVREFEIEETAEFSEDSELSDTPRSTHATARTAWSGRLTCWWDDTDTNGQESLDAGNSVTLNVRPEGTGASDAQLSGLARITRERWRVAEGVVEREFEFEGSGALSRANQ